MDLPLSRFVDALPHGVAVWDLAECGDDPGAMRLAYANPAASAMTGVDFQPLVGETMREAFPAVLGLPTETNFARTALLAREQGSTIRMPPMQYGDRRVETNWFRMHAVPFADCYVACVYENITAEKEATRRADEQEDSLAELNEGLRVALRETGEREKQVTRSNEDLEKFAYLASHDLQEPLRMVSGYLQLLARRYREQLDEDADEFIGYALDGAARMKQLINDLLDYSRVNRRGQPRRPVDVGPLWAGVVDDHSRAIADQGARVTHDELPTIHADASQLRRVFANLLANALRYRDEERAPEIHLSATRFETPQASGWEFALRDNGIGIEERFYNRIFEIFQQLHAGGQYPGTGIGLAISRRIIQRHGGDIHVESDPGRGSVFTFTIPDAGPDDGDGEPPIENEDIP